MFLPSNVLLPIRPVVISSEIVSVVSLHLVKTPFYLVHLTKAKKKVSIILLISFDNGLIFTPGWGRRYFHVKIYISRNLHQVKVLFHFKKLLTALWPSAKSFTHRIVLSLLNQVNWRLAYRRVSRFISRTDSSPEISLLRN